MDSKLTLKDLDKMSKIDLALELYKVNPVRYFKTNVKRCTKENIKNILIKELEL